MKERQQPETLRLRSVTAGLTVDDLAASIAWYEGILGFVVTERFEHDGKIHGASLQAGSVSLWLGQDDFAKGRDRNKGVGLRLYGTTHQDIDELAAAVKARGGELDHEPTDQPWGTRDFAVTDPDGFKITITTPLGS